MRDRVPGSVLVTRTSITGTSAAFTVTCTSIKLVIRLPLMFGTKWFVSIDNRQWTLCKSLFHYIISSFYFTYISMSSMCHKNPSLTMLKQVIILTQVLTKTQKLPSVQVKVLLRYSAHDLSHRTGNFATGLISCDGSCLVSPYWLLKTGPAQKLLVWVQFTGNLYVYKTCINMNGCCWNIWTRVLELVLASVWTQSYSTLMLLAGWQVGDLVSRSCCCNSCQRFVFGDLAWPGVSLESKDWSAKQKINVVE